jgi:hypothetical protein
MSTVYYKDKLQNATADTGTDIRDVTNGEVLEQIVLNRPTNNLKNRTDEISRYLETLRVERLLDSTRHISMVEIDSSGSRIGPGMLEIKKDGSSYFVIPGNIHDPSNSNTYRLLVTSGIENAGCYSISREAFHAFYTDNQASGYSGVKGLTNAADTISLAVPRYADSVITNATKDIVDGASGAKSLLEAQYLDDATINITNVVSESTSNALIKTPRINQVRLELNPTATSTQLFTDFVSAGISQLSVETVVGANPAVTTELDTYGIEITGTQVSLYLKSYGEVGDLFTAADTLSFSSTDQAGIVFNFASGEFTASNHKGQSPPFDFIIPLFYLAGDRIIVPDVGSVLISEVDRIDAAGGTIMLRGDGKVVTNTADGEVDFVYTQNRFAVTELGTNHAHLIEAPLFKDLSLENSHYSLKTVELVGVENPTANIYALIGVKEAGTVQFISAIFDGRWGGSTPIIHASSGSYYDAMDLVELADHEGAIMKVPAFSGRTSNEAQDGDTLAVQFSSVFLDDTTNTIDTAVGVVLRLGYVKTLEY